MQVYVGCPVPSLLWILSLIMDDGVISLEEETPSGNPDLVETCVCVSV